MGQEKIFSETHNAFEQPFWRCKLSSLLPLAKGRELMFEFTISDKVQNEEIHVNVLVWSLQIFRSSSDWALCSSWLHGTKSAMLQMSRLCTGTSKTKIVKLEESKLLCFRCPSTQVAVLYHVTVSCKRPIVRTVGTSKVLRSLGFFGSILPLTKHAPSKPIRIW